MWYHMLLGLRKHDVCFLVTVRAQMSLNDTFDSKQNFAKQVNNLILIKEILLFTDWHRIC